MMSSILFCILVALGFSWVLVCWKFYSTSTELINNFNQKKKEKFIMKKHMVRLASMLIMLFVIGCSDNGSAKVYSPQAPAPAPAPQQSVSFTYTPDSTNAADSFVFETSTNHLELNEDSASVVSIVTEQDSKCLRGGVVNYGNSLSVVEQTFKLNGTPKFTSKKETLEEAILEFQNSSVRRHDAEHDLQRAEQEYVDAVRNNGLVQQKFRELNEARDHYLEIVRLNDNAEWLVNSLAQGYTNRDFVGTIFEVSAGAPLFKYGVSFTPPISAVTLTAFTNLKFEVLNESVTVTSVQESQGALTVNIKLGAKNVQFVEKQAQGQDAFVFVDGNRIDAEAQILHSVSTSAHLLEGFVYAPFAHSLARTLPIRPQLPDDVLVKENYPLHLYTPNQNVFLSDKWEVLFKGRRRTNFNGFFEVENRGNFEYDLRFSNKLGTFYKVDNAIILNRTLYLSRLINTESTVILGDSLLVSANGVTSVLQYNSVSCGPNSSGVIVAQWAYFRDDGTNTDYSAQVINGQNGQVTINGTVFLFVFGASNCTDITFDVNGDGMLNGSTVNIELPNGYTVDLGKLEKYMAAPPQFKFSVPSSAIENPFHQLHEFDVQINTSNTLSFSWTGFSVAQPYAGSNNDFEGMGQDGSRLYFWTNRWNNSFSVNIPEQQVFMDLELKCKN